MTHTCIEIVKADFCGEPAIAVWPHITPSFFTKGGQFHIGIYTKFKCEYHHTLISSHYKKVWLTIDEYELFRMLES